MATERHIRHPEAFDQCLNRIAACADWTALGAVLDGVDAHWKKLGLTLDEVELISRNAQYWATKIPEEPQTAEHAEYAEQQMATRAARQTGT